MPVMLRDFSSITGFLPKHLLPFLRAFPVRFLIESLPVFTAVSSVDLRFISKFLPGLFFFKTFLLMLLSRCLRVFKDLSWIFSQDFSGATSRGLSILDFSQDFSGAISRSPVVTSAGVVADISHGVFFAISFRGFPGFSSYLFPEFSEVF